MRERERERKRESNEDYLCASARVCEREGGERVERVRKGKRFGRHLLFLFLLHSNYFSFNSIKHEEALL